MRVEDRLLRRVLPILLCCLTLFGLAGCWFGKTANPSYFPYWLPPGDVVQTHAKPPGLGYFADFDPYACKVELRPKVNSVQVGGTQVFIATVFDKEGNARRNRRVEWIVEGPGAILEVDESGYKAGRGYKLTNNYAVSYTDTFEHIIDRGNKNPEDDFVIKPGQTWCIVSSPKEGETKVTAYIPAINNWDNNRVVATTYWLDAAWAPPQPQTARGRARLVTRVYRASDRRELANYRVRYTVRQGGPAVQFPSTGTMIGEATTNNLGEAAIDLQQTTMEPGRSMIDVEVLKPPNPDVASTGPGVVIFRGETYVDWTGPTIMVNKVGPATVGVGTPFPYTITITNTGTVASDPAMIVDELPDGLQADSATPMFSPNGNRYQWRIQPLNPGQQFTITFNVKAIREGTFNNRVFVVGPDGNKLSEQSTMTTVTKPGLTVDKRGPAKMAQGAVADFQISVTNTGNTPLKDVRLEDVFSQGFIWINNNEGPGKEMPGVNKLTIPIATLAPGETQTRVLQLRAVQSGRLTNTVFASAQGVDAKEAVWNVDVTSQNLSLSHYAPKARYVNGRITWRIEVKNENNEAIERVVVRDNLPPEVQIITARQDMTVDGNTVLWNVGTLQPQEKKVLDIETTAKVVTPQAVSTVVATYGQNLEAKATQTVEIRGVPALLMQAAPVNGKDAPINVGETIRYQIILNNTGSLPIRDIEISIEFDDRILQFNQGTSPDGTPATVRDKTITFAKLSELIPNDKQSAIFNLEFTGKQPGDGRFIIKRKSALDGPDPVTDEEQIVVLPQ